MAGRTHLLHHKWSYSIRNFLSQHAFTTLAIWSWKELSRGEIKPQEIFVVKTTKQQWFQDSYLGWCIGSWNKRWNSVSISIWKCPRVTTGSSISINIQLASIVRPKLRYILWICLGYTLLISVSPTPFSSISQLMLQLLHCMQMKSFHLCKLDR